MILKSQGVRAIIRLRTTLRRVMPCLVTPPQLLRLLSQPRVVAAWLFFFFFFRYFAHEAKHGSDETFCGCDIFLVKLFELSAGLQIGHLKREVEALSIFTFFFFFF